MIPFTYISTTQTRVPGVEAEVDSSQANTGVGALNTLIIGQITAGGTARAGYPVLMPSSLTAVDLLCGPGSQLAMRARRYQARDTVGTVWLLPLSDDGASVAATGTITIATQPTSSGTIVRYVGGQRVLQAVTGGMATTAIATAIAATINANTLLCVTAAATASTVTLTAKNKGLCGNDILSVPNFYGAAGGESFPAGYTETIVAMTGGTTNPSLTIPLLNLGEQPFEFYGMPYNDTTSLTAFNAFMADDIGRWSPTKMLYGHAIGAFRGTVGALTTFGLSQGSQHMSTMGFPALALDPYWIWDVDVLGSIAGSVRANPAQPFNTLPLGVAPPTSDQRFVFSDRNTLLFDGISTFLVDAGSIVRIERLITNYQFNPAGAPDNSYLNAERMFQLGQVIRLIKNFQLTTFPRAIIVADGSYVPPNSSYVNTATVRAAVIGFYQQLELAGIVTNSVAFAAGIRVENAGGGVFAELLPITLPNQLELIAMKVQFKAA